MSWIYVLCAGIVEILWVLGLKYANSPLTWGTTVVLIFLSFFFIMKANERLPAGTVYAVFTGMGTAGIALTDIFYFETPVSWTKILFLCCIVTGVIGVKCVTVTQKADGAAGRRDAPCAGTAEACMGGPDAADGGEK